MASPSQLASTDDGRIPVPDPTVLTTQQLVREVNSLREIMESKIAAVSDLAEHRVNSIELRFKERDTRFEQAARDNSKAIDAALQAAKEAAAAIDEKTAHLQALHAEKFLSIQLQFQERDVRTEGTSRDSKVAVDAALQAAKEAVGEQNRSSALAIAKSEAATAKAIDQLQVILQTATAAIDGKIVDLKERLGAVENKNLGQTTARSEQQGSQIQWVGIMGLVLGAVVGLGGIIMALGSRDSSPQVIERVIAPPLGAGEGPGLR